MCGIVGYIGKASAPSVLISGLRRLEYRGYDSAGMAILEDGSIVVSKAPGKVSALNDKAHADWPADRFVRSSTGIAHTRWATHGPPTEVNAHPHLDQSGDIALVHNGIIENYRSLRTRMEAKGHHFYSETDTEVLAHLIGDRHQGDLFQAVCDALSQVEGTFGIAVISAKEPGKIITARRGSPIVIGVGEGETIVASDASAIIAHTRQVIYLEDNDIAVVTADHVDIRDLHQVPVAREVSELGFDAAAAEKGGFAHFMLKEIHEQPDSLRNAIRGRLDFNLGSSVLSGMGTSQRDLAEIQRVVFVGCGTSLHAGLVGEYAIEDMADLHAEVQQAAEFRYRNPIIGSRDLVVAISQSGETADTLAAVREANQKGAFFIGRGPLYPVALEGALKLKEISYMHAEGYHAAELKHGPIALLQEGTPVIALANDIPGKDKTLGNVEECRARGARILGIVTEGDREAMVAMDDMIEVPACHPLVSTIPTVVALQLLAYHIAKARGCEIDQPRNLAKSVTVE